MSDPSDGGLCVFLAQNGAILMIGLILSLVSVGALAWGAERFLIRPAIRRGAPKPVYPALKRALKALAAAAVVTIVAVALPLAAYARYGCGL